MLSGQYDSVGDVCLCVKLILPLVLFEIINVEGVQCPFLFIHLSKWVNIIFMG